MRGEDEVKGRGARSSSSQMTKKLDQLQMPISRKRKDLAELRSWQKAHNFGAFLSFKKKTFLEK